LLLGGILLLFLLVLTGIERYLVRHPRYEVDPGLLAELASATFLEEDLPSASAGWPGWLGPHRDGVTHDPDLLLEWPGRGPKRLWRITGGAGFSAVTVGKGRAYTLVADDTKEAVVCWNAATGKELWRYPYADEVASSYPGPRSTPTLDGDRLYTVGSDGQFLCLAADTGKVLWQHALLSEFGASKLSWGVAFSPLVDGDRVYTCPGGSKASVVAFDRGSGDVVWSAGNDPAGYSSPVAATVDGVRLILAFTGKSLLAIDADSGDVQSRQPWLTQYDVNAATPLVFRTRNEGQVSTYVFVSSGYGRGCGLFKIASHGEGRFGLSQVYSNTHLCAHFSTPLRYRDHVYGFNESELVCMSLRDGTVRWSQKGFHKGCLLRVDDHVIVQGEQGQLGLFDPSTEEFRLRTQCQPFPHRPAKAWTLPSLADGRLYLRDEKEVICLEVRRR
jgi:outer membrane protein assembly factor BamB